MDMPPQQQAPVLFPALPSELQTHILIFLPPEALARIHQVNTTGRDLLKDPAFRARWLVAHYTRTGALYWGLKKHRPLLRLRSPDTGESVIDALVIQGVRVTRYLVQEVGLWLFNMDNHYRYSQIESLTGERPNNADENPPSAFPTLADQGLYEHLLKHALIQYSHKPDGIRFAHSDLYIARSLVSAEDDEDLPQQVGVDNSWFGRTKVLVASNLARLTELLDDYDFLPAPPIFLHRYQNDEEALHQLVVDTMAGLAVGAPDLLGRVLPPLRTILSFAEPDLRLSSAIAALYERVMEKSGPTPETPAQFAEVLIHPDFPRSLVFPREAVQRYLEQHDMFYLNQLRDIAARLPEPEDPEFVKEVDEFLKSESEEGGLELPRQRTGKADVFLEVVAKKLFREKWERKVADSQTEDGTTTTLVVTHPEEVGKQAKSASLGSDDVQLMTNVVEAMWPELNDRLKFLQRLSLSRESWTAELDAFPVDTPFSDVKSVIGLPRLRDMDGSRVGFLAQIVKGIWHPLPAQPEIEPICSDLVDSCFVHLILDSLVFPSNKVETEVAAELKAMTAQWAPGPCVLATVAFGGALLISRFMSAPGIKNVDAYLSERTWPNSPSLDASTMDPTASVASTTTPVTAGAMGSLASATSSVESNILASTTVSPQPIETEQEKRGRLGRKMIERLAICLDTISELMLSWIEMSPRVSHTENGGTMREDEVQRLLNLILTPAQRVTLASQWGFGHIQQTSLPARDGKNVALSSLLPTAATVEDPSFATVSTSSDVGTQSVDVASGISTADSLIPSGSSTSSASEQPVVASASPFNEVATSASNNAAGEGAPPRPILTPLDIPSPSTLLGQPSRISEQYHLPNLHSPISLLGYFRLLSDYYAGVVYDTEKKRRSDSSGEQILEGSTLRHLFSPTSSMNIEDLKTYEEAMRSNAAKPKKAPIRYGATYGLGPRGNHSAKNQVLMEWGTRAPESHLYRINIYAGDFLERLTFFFTDGTKKSVGRVLYYRPPDYSLIIPPGEHITSIAGRSGHWLDGIQFELSNGVKTPYLGGQGGNAFQAGPVGRPLMAQPALCGVKAYGSVDHFVSKLTFGFCDIDWEAQQKNRRERGRNSDVVDESPSNPEELLEDLRTLFPTSEDPDFFLQVGEGGSEESEAQGPEYISTEGGATTFESSNEEGPGSSWFGSINVMLGNLIFGGADA